jgi:hypothetical protein
MTSEIRHKPDIAEVPDAALYIASLADELARLAKSHELDALAYLLDMARLEADQVSKRWGGQGSR